MRRSRSAEACQPIGTSPMVVSAPPHRASGDALRGQLGRESVLRVGSCWCASFLRGMDAPRRATTVRTCPVDANRPRSVAFAWFEGETECSAESERSKAGHFTRQSLASLDERCHGEDGSDGRVESEGEALHLRRKTCVLATRSVSSLLFASLLFRFGRSPKRDGPGGRSAALEAGDLPIGDQVRLLSPLLLSPLSLRAQPEAGWTRRAKRCT
jgi:hypothetical protein